MVNSRKMFLLQIQVSWVPFNVLCLLNLIYNLCLLFRFCLLILALAFLFDYVIVLVCHRCVYVCASSHVVPFNSHSYHIMHNHGIILMNASHSSIIVTKPSEDEPTEPVEVVEPKPGVEFVLEPERKPRKAAKHDPLHLFKLIQFSYFIWVLLGYIYNMLCIAFL